MDKILTLYIRGTCVDDLFHILASNGYAVQLSTTSKNSDIFRVDVVINKESEEK